MLFTNVKNIAIPHIPPVLNPVSICPFIDKFRQLVDAIF